MNLHPAISMLGVWVLGATAYFILPYQLLDRQMTGYGAVGCATFLMAYILGTLLVRRQRTTGIVRSPVELDARSAEFWLMLASALATVFFLLDAHDRQLFDLARAYELRTESADALLKGKESLSSAWFRLAFLLYPAGYVYTATHILFAQHFRKGRLLFFGFLPIVLAALLMGGRMPLFYSLMVGLLAFKERRRVGHASHVSLTERTAFWRHTTYLGLMILVCLVLLYYFSSVFMVRAETMGGAAGMFEVAEKQWGVGFRGPFSTIIFFLLGDELAYLLFVFTWYLVQGFVIGNHLFSAYDGPMQFGVYGADLLSALVRRIDPDRLAVGFDSLLKLGTYGFFPSAWGSLYVDFGYLGLAFCLAWGALASLAYKRIVFEQRRDWMLVGPFVSIGIACSIINTPFGLTNGLVTHAWLCIAFFMLRTHRSLGHRVAPDAEER